VNENVLKQILEASDQKETPSEPKPMKQIETEESDKKVVVMEEESGGKKKA
jgi:hypothetical protein